MRTKLILGSILVAITLAAAAGQNADWTQWRGPGRDGTVTSFVEPKAWPQQNMLAIKPPNCHK